MSSHTGEIILGLLGSAFFVLLWRRLDAIDRRIDKIETRLELIQKDMREFYGVTQKLEGRIDEISHRVK
jgi:hypothetical protein